MQVIDLTHYLVTGIPAYPGSDPAGISQIASFESDGYNETSLNFSSHTGTHIDCGRHFIHDGFDTGRTTPERFIGNGMVIDCRNLVNRQVISRRHLIPYESRLERAEFVLLHTGWSRFWGSENYFSGYPVPDSAAAQYLSRFNLKGIGTDTISPDPLDSHDYAVHKILLSAGMTLVENLTNLENLPANGFLFCCLPLKIMDGDGSPVRAVGITGSME